MNTIKAADLRRGMTIKVQGAWRKVARVSAFFEFVSVGFANGDSIRWNLDHEITVREA